MIQKRMTGKVTPEAFTHGTADQRVEWLRRGLSTGDPAACDTFSQ
jgi:predicted metalloprotease